MKLILLGAPGAGKGTQAAVISRELGIPAISTGNILRAAIQEGTPTGMKAKTYMDEGHLVPDEVIIGIIKERLAEPDCAKGFILDGVPRTIAQAEALEAAGIKFDHVVSLEIADATIMERMSGRRVCSKCGASYHIVAVPPKAEGVCDVCGGELVTRKDDKPETVKNRLAVSKSISILPSSLSIKSRAPSLWTPRRPISTASSLYGSPVMRICS